MADNKFSTEEMIARCVPMSKLQSVLNGKWKILILWYVTFYKVQRFGELMRRLDGITQSTLIELGESFVPVLQTMMTWSETYLCPDYKNPYKNNDTGEVL